MGSLADAQVSWFKQPVFHLRAPQGWLNDPCAPAYDPATGKYHLFYQWNPKSCDWGDIAWGHYTSQDGLHWTHQGMGPVLKPDQRYDNKGIFTGCFYPTGQRGEAGRLVVFYSSVQHLPIHWSLPYTKNCAGLSIATSDDGGLKWHKSPANPVLHGEPDGVVVTGFRDPYLAPWPTMDQQRQTGAEKGTLYGILAGGIVGRGPNVFLYAVPTDDLTSWIYLGPLVDIPVDSHPPNHWSGDYGINWECANFMTLRADNTEDTCEQHEQDFVIFSSEGGFAKGQHPIHGATSSTEARQGNWTLWVAGTLQRVEGASSNDGGVSVRLRSDFSGLLDCGMLYAPNSYHHPDTGKRICWGWIREKRLPAARREARGWAGYLSMPRELFLLRLPNVLRAWKTPLSAIPSIQVVNASHQNNGENNTASESNRAVLVYTLGVQPLSDLTALRCGLPRVWTSITAAQILTTTRSSHWELQASIHVRHGLQRVGFHVRQSADLARRVSIYLAPDHEEIVVDASLSNDILGIPKDVLSGPFTLFTFSGHQNGRVERTEKFHLHIFCDGDVLEVFANGRFALSAAIYGDSDGCRGISCFVEGLDGDATQEPVFESVQQWELQSVYDM